MIARKPSHLERVFLGPKPSRSGSIDDLSVAARLGAAALDSFPWRADLAEGQVARRDFPSPY